MSVFKKFVALMALCAISAPVLAGISGNITSPSPIYPALKASADTASPILYTDTTGAIIADAPDLLWDDTNKRLGINQQGSIASATIDAHCLTTACLIADNVGAQSTTGGAGISGLSDSGAAMVSGNRLGFFTLGGATDSSHTTNNSSAIEAFATENWSGTAAGSNLAFSTTANTTLTRTTRFTIDHNGVATFTNSVKLPSVYINTRILISGTAPTISSGFGTSPSIAEKNGTAAFIINVGTGGVASSGVIGLAPAISGWNCFATDRTNPAANNTKQTATTTTTVTLTNYDNSGVAKAWSASDILSVSCFAY